jgi:mannose-6-phosphate isomerase-like protein (cupin superfamily)
MVTTEASPANPTNGHSYRTLNVLGVATDVLLSAHQTHGACSVFRITIPANYANPPHVHWFEDETFYILQGELEVTVGSIPTVVKAGQAAFGPRRVIHSFANKTAAPVVAIVHASPGGLERFFEACDTAFPEGTPIDPVQLVNIIERHGMSIV